MALTAARATQEILDAKHQALPVAASARCFQGGLAMIVGGYVKPGAVVANGLGVGVFENTYDNSAGAAGDITARVRKGVFKFGNYASDPVPASQVGQPCYIYDDATVAATSATSRWSWNSRGAKNRDVRTISPSGLTPK